MPGEKKLAKRDYETLRVVSEIVKNGFTVLAIIVGGWWTYTHFLRAEAPSLEPRAVAISSLWWKPVDDKKCEATFDVTFTNTGNTSLSITRVEVRGWKYKRPSGSGATVTFLDTDAIKNGELIFERTYSYNPTEGVHMFIGSYPPTASFHHAFEFIANMYPDYGVYFEADFFKQSGTFSKDGRIFVYTGAWDRLCNSEKIFAYSVAGHLSHADAELIALGVPPPSPDPT